MRATLRKEVIAVLQINSVQQCAPQPDCGTTALHSMLPSILTPLRLATGAQAAPHMHEAAASRAHEVPHAATSTVHMHIARPRLLDKLSSSSLSQGINASTSVGDSCSHGAQPARQRHTFP